MKWGKQMYKVLIVDDERIIREGIKNGIPWENYNIGDCATAENGIEAYDAIMTQTPDIVITDIKMPGMDGLELISKVYEKYPSIIFILLSGYGEFKYAHEAMKFGVKHYLLKPCNEEEIENILEEVLLEFKEKEKKEKFLKDMDYNLKKVLPEVKDQFLRNFVLEGGYSEAELNYFLKLFKIQEDKFKLVILKLNNKCDLTEKFALKNIAYEVIREDQVYLSTLLEDSLLLLIKAIELDELMNLLLFIKDTFMKFFKSEISIAVSNDECFKNIRKMYLELQECLKCEFYLGEGKILTRKSIVFNQDAENFNVTVSNGVIEAAKSGNIDELNSHLEAFFHILEQKKLEIELAKNYCVELFLGVIRQSSTDKMKNYTNGIGEIQAMNTLASIYSYVKHIANEITKENFDRNNERYGMIINTILKCVDKNIQNPKLSLNWIAKEVLFMNENYLGKLFHKSTNEKFSQYVMKIRMEKAKELIKDNVDYKIYEITEQIGFEDNTQYFSQVFKKFTGYTPSQYKNVVINR